MTKNLILIFLLLVSIIGYGQTDKTFCETLQSINTLIQQEHYNAKKVDDSLSVYVFNTFLDKLDENNSIFIASDIDFLKKHQYKIDDYITTNNCEFINDFYTIYKIAVNRLNLVIESIKNEPFPYSINDKLSFSKKKLPYLTSEKDLKYLYKKSILFLTLKDVALTSTNKDSLVKVFNTTVNAAKIKTLDKYSCKSNKLNISQNDFYTQFFSVFCSYFDPHTDFFTKTDKSTFLSSVSADNLTFGMDVSLNDDDEIIVNQILPGSDAYFSKKIEVEDQILKIKYQKEEFSIACSNIKKINEIFSSNDYKNVEFTLRKKSGQLYSVNLTKKVMKDYQNNVFSYILEKDNHKTGYIKIPSFYSTFENGKTNVSDDVVKEIFKLKNDKIDNLIIDLENNGGGSMEEAIKLCGQFIDVGPLSILNDKLNKKEIIKDYNRGTLYNGKMAVIINGFSASASEFFANAMQDYNRAIVVGSKSMGKASMQRIVPLKNNNDGFVKLTIEKFYRITGKSNQTIGVTPDIIIENLFEKQMPSEKDYPTALKNDTISMNLKYTKIPLSERDIIAIENSKNRIKVNPNVLKIQNLNKKVNQLYDDFAPINLNFDDIFKEVHKTNDLWDELKDFGNIQYPFEVKNNTVDIDSFKYDEYLKKQNIDKIEIIKNNINIQESIDLLIDLK